MTVLSDGEQLVTGERREQYGPPVECMARTAAAWTAVLGVPVQARQVALCLAAMKLVREGHAHRPDNLVDAAGYVLIADLCAEAAW